MTKNKENIDSDNPAELESPDQDTESGAAAQESEIHKEVEEKINKKDETLQPGTAAQKTELQKTVTEKLFDFKIKDYHPGSDTTGLQEVRSEISEDKGEVIVNKEIYQSAVDFINAGIPTEASKFDDKIKSGLAILHRLETQSNLAHHVAEGCYVNYQIQNGKILNVLKTIHREKEKKMEKTKRKGWTFWADENIKFIAPKTRRTYMSLAVREDVHPFAYLGSERCVHLIGVTSGKDDDTVDGFFQKHNLEFDFSANKEEDLMLIKEFKHRIDAAIAVEKGRDKYKLEDLKIDKVQCLIALSFKPSKTFFENLKIVHEAGGNMDTHLDQLHSDLLEKEKAPASNREKESFDKLVSKLTEQIEEIIENEERLVNLDVDVLTELLEKVNLLQEKKQNVN